MNKLTNSKIWALWGCQVIAIPMLAYTWGSFDERTAVGFLIGNAVWNLFILNGLFGYVQNDEVIKSKI